MTRSTNQKSSGRVLLAMMVMGIISGSLVGCAPVETKLTSDEILNRMHGNSHPPAMCYVTIDDQWNSPETVEIPLNGPKTVQDVLEEADAFKSFSKTEVEIVRQIPNRPRPLRLPVTFESRTKSVRVEQNYQILPGDRLMVTTTTSNPISELVTGTLGSWSE